MKARKIFYAMIKSSNLIIYKARRKYFKNHHKSVYLKIKPKIKLITRVKDAPYRFGFITSSVLEGINGALEDARKYEPIYLIESFLEFSISQWNYQREQIRLGVNFKFMNITASIINAYEKADLKCFPKQQNTFEVIENEDGMDCSFIITK